MAGKEIDDVAARITELQAALDELAARLGRLHETIDLIEPTEPDTTIGAATGTTTGATTGAATGAADGGSDVIDLRDAVHAGEGSRPNSPRHGRESPRYGRESPRDRREHR